LQETSGDHLVQTPAQGRADFNLTRLKEVKIVPHK